MLAEIILYISLLISVFVFMKLQDVKFLSMFGRILIALIFPIIALLFLLMGLFGLIFVGVILLLGLIFLKINKNKIRVIKI
jgi:hypothetical protein